MYHTAPQAHQAQHQHINFRKLDKKHLFNRIFDVLNIAAFDFKGVLQEINRTPCVFCKKKPLIALPIYSLNI
jgi:hypothetical protein